MRSKLFLFVFSSSFVHRAAQILIFSFSPRCVMRVRGVACAFHASSEKYVTGARLLAVEMHYGLRRFWRGGDIRQ